MLERAQCGLVLVENGSPLGSPPLTVVGAIGHRAPVRACPPGHYEESGSRAPALPRASSVAEYAHLPDALWGGCHAPAVTVADTCRVCRRAPGLSGRGGGSRI